ncbi:hypothetical protein AB7M73_001930 [Bradyrhizobium japonicum]
MAGNSRRAVADHLLADAGAQPVRADQQAPGDALAGLEQGRGLRTVLLVADDVAIGPKRDISVRFAGADEDAVQIAAVNHGVGIAEAPAEIVGQIDIGDLLRRDCVHQAEPVDEDGDRACSIAELEAIEGVKRVGAELDARADLLVARRALEDRDLETLPCQRDRGCKPADAAACNDDGILSHGLSLVVPYFLAVLPRGRFVLAFASGRSSRISFNRAGGGTLIDPASTSCSSRSMFL